ncbi:MAG: hypothetical protein AB1540_06260 [Bdellovibrionota bacterium]
MIRLKPILAAVVLPALLPVLAMANSLSAEPFFKHFTVMRDSKGNADLIMINTKPQEVQMSAYLEELQGMVSFAMSENLLDENALVQNFDAQDLQAWPKNYQRAAGRSLKELQTVDLEGIAKDKKFSSVMKSVGSIFKKHLMGSKVVANLNDKRFFYSRAGLSQVLSIAQQYIEQRIPPSQALELAKLLAGRVAHSIQTRRAFHQYMLLHYLENFEPKDLGLTAQEVARAKSSIYESKIPGYAFWQSNKAKRTWDKFGTAHFDRTVAAGGARLARNKKFYEFDQRVNYAFSIVSEKGKKKIVNLMNPRFMYSKKPSDAYFFDNPYRVQRQRLLIQLAQMGLRFVPVADLPMLIAKSALNSFLSSMYVPHQITEGALLAYFETVKDAVGAKALGEAISDPTLMQDLAMP